MNYFSSVKLWVTSGPGDSAAFNVPEIKTMKRGIAKNSLHVVNKAPALNPDEFKAIITYMCGLSSPPYVLIAALLVGYLTLARQSNLVLTSTELVDSPHVLKFGHIKVVEGALLVTFVSTKTRFASAPPIIFRLPVQPGSVCCPVNAWLRYANSVTLTARSPAFVLPTGRYLSACTLLRALKLVSFAVFGYDKGFSLHSLRRGATQACQGAGLSLDTIMSAGMWRSSAINTYLQAIHISSAPAALSSMLG